MKELNGIETAKSIRKFDKKCIIIIITSLLSYAVEGYGINAFDFILKPVNRTKFQDVIERAVYLIKKAENATYIVEARDKTSIIKKFEKNNGVLRYYRFCNSTKYSYSIRKWRYTLFYYICSKTS